MSFSVEIPGWAPTLNETYRPVPTAKGMRLAKSSEVATWQDTLAWLVRAAKPRDWKPARRVLITIEWHQARARDCDAGVKAALDAVAVGLGVNDSIFLLSVPVNEIDKANPRSKITIENAE